MSDFDVDRAQEKYDAAGDQASLDRLLHAQNLRYWRREDAEAGGGPSGSDGDLGGLLWLMALAIPFVALYLVVTGVALGAQWVAQESLLAFLFPRSGASLPRAMLSVATIIVILSGGSLGAARAVHGRSRGLHALRYVLLPVAVLAVPIVLVTAAWSLELDVVRLPS